MKRSIQLVSFLTFCSVFYSIYFLHLNNTHTYTSYIIQRHTAQHLLLTVPQNLTEIKQLYQTPTPTPLNVTRYSTRRAKKMVKQTSSAPKAYTVPKLPDPTPPPTIKNSFEVEEPNFPNKYAMQRMGLWETNKNNLFFLRKNYESARELKKVWQPYETDPAIIDSLLPESFTDIPFAKFFFEPHKTCAGKCYKNYKS